LYRYSQRAWLERSLRFGEFRIRPAVHYKLVETDAARNDDELVRIRVVDPAHVKITHTVTRRQILPIGPVTFRSKINTDYLVLCFSTVWEEKLFDKFAGTDSCLIIHEPDEFCERIHVAAEAFLPSWCGIDAAVTYGGKSQLGPAFSKPLRFFEQQEWRFAWIPPDSVKIRKPVTLSIGNIEAIAELRTRTWRGGPCIRK
jgi:hypothetical protein